MMGIVITSVFIFLVAVLVFVYSLSSTGEHVPEFLSVFLQYHIHFMVLMGLFGVASGLIFYSMMNSTIQKDEKIAKANLEIIMKFLGNEDKKILTLLKAKEGMTTQSEISKLEGMTRLKAHRVVKKLEDRGIVHVEKHGKINVLRLVDELRQ